MEIKMRHWAIIGASVATVAAMFNDIPLDQLTAFYGFMVAIVIGDKAISLKTKV